MNKRYKKWNKRIYFYKEQNIIYLLNYNSSSIYGNFFVLFVMGYTFFNRSVISSGYNKKLNVY